ncbi:MAG: cell division protein FtsA [Chthonomonadaceae bacterium]|nr:cell division protein FtsA [Chthonomonadaceae bacterium]
MAKNDTICGLDIGTTKVCALIGEIAEGGRILITGVGISPSTGMKKGVVVDIEATTRAVEEAVGKACKQAGKEVDSVYVGVTGDHIASLNSNGRIAITHPDREITQGDVDRVLESSRVIVLPPDRQIVHAIPRAYAVDGQGGIRQPIGMSGTRLEVQTHIVHGAITFLQNVEKCVTKAGLSVAEDVLEPIATAESVLLPAEKELGVCLVDIGGGTSDMAVFFEGEIYYSAVIPVGGNHVTNDVAYGLTVAHEEAERLKTESGHAVMTQIGEEDVITVRQIGREESRRLRRKALVQIIEPRMQELFQLVLEELERAGCMGKIPAGLVISGGGSQLKGCVEVAQEETGLSVRIGYPQGVGGLGETLTHPSYATAIGLVQYGARQLQNSQPESRENFGSGIMAWLKRMMSLVFGRE